MILRCTGGTLRRLVFMCKWVTWIECSESTSVSNANAVAVPCVEGPLAWLYVACRSNTRALSHSIKAEAEAICGKEANREREKMNGGKEGGKEERRGGGKRGGRKERGNWRSPSSGLGLCGRTRKLPPFCLLAVLSGVGELADRRLCWWGSAFQATKYILKADPVPRALRLWTYLPRPRPGRPWAL